MDVKKRLAQMQKEYEAAKDRDPSSGFENIPDGQYTLRLVGAELGESQNGRFQAVMEWQVEGGDYDGRSVYDYQGLDNEDGIFYFGRLLSRLEAEMPEEATDLPNVLESLEERRPLITGQLRTKGDFQNLRVRKLIESKGEAQNGEPEAEETDDEEFDVGDMVLFKWDGDECVGKITSWKDDTTAVIEDDEGEADVSLDDIIRHHKDGEEHETTDGDEPSGEDETETEEEEGLAVGDKVSVEDEDGNWEGEITEVADDTAEVKDAEGDLYDVPWESISALEEDEPVTEDSGDEGVDVGTRVTFKFRGKEYTGEILSFPDEDTALVKCTDGKERKAKLEKCEVAEDDPPATLPAKRKKGGKPPKK